MVLPLWEPKPIWFPELYDVAEKRDSGQNPRADLFKTDIYSAALVILYCSGISEKDISKGINCITKKKHQDDIENYIDVNIRDFYPGLDVLVRRMSTFNLEERVDVIEALRIIEGLDPGAKAKSNPNSNPNPNTNPFSKQVIIPFYYNL